MSKSIRVTFTDAELDCIRASIQNSRKHFILALGADVEADEIKKMAAEIGRFNEILEKIGRYIPLPKSIG